MEKYNEIVKLITKYEYNFYCPECKVYNLQKSNFLQNVLFCDTCNFALYFKKLIKNAFPKKRKLNYYYYKGIKGGVKS